MYIPLSCSFIIRYTVDVHPVILFMHTPLYCSRTPRYTVDGYPVILFMYISVKNTCPKYTKWRNQLIMSLSLHLVDIGHEFSVAAHLQLQDLFGCNIQTSTGSAACQVI